jgi:penicillin-binding protein 2
VHVTGYTRYIREEELADYMARGYSADQRIGETGLEAWGEAILSGRNGGQLTLLDSAGQPLRALAFGEYTDAQDIYTTLDFDLQQAAETALGPLARWSPCGWIRARCWPWPPAHV